MKSNKPLIWLLVCIVLTGLGYYVSLHLKRTTIDIPAIPTGEAASNDYYAAQMLVQRLGYPTHKVADSRELVSLPTNATLVLTSTAIIDNRDQKRKAALLDWVRRGGHLLIDISHSDIRESKREHDAAYGPTLLDGLGITPERMYDRPCNKACREAHKKNRDSDKTKELDSIQLEGSTLCVNLDYQGIAFSLKSQPLWQVQLPMFEERNGDDEADENGERPDPPLKLNTLIARYREGNGWVTVTNTEIFQNDTLKNDQNAALFARLATLPDGKRPVFFALRADYPSLPVWLWQNASAVLLACLLLTLMVLWRVMPRFGPLLPPLPSDRPGLLVHLRAVGDFHMRHQDYAALLTPLRDEVERALLPLRAQYPDIDSTPRLAAHVSKMPLQELGNALTRLPDDRAQFVMQVRILTMLLDLLHGSRKQK